MFARLNSLLAGKALTTANSIAPRRAVPIVPVQHLWPLTLIVVGVISDMCHHKRDLAAAAESTLLARSQRGAPIQTPQGTDSVRVRQLQRAKADFTASRHWIRRLVDNAAA